MSVLLKDILEKTLVSLDKDIPTVREKVSQFLLDNAWFGVSIDTNVFSVSEAEATILKDKVKDFLTVQPGMDTISVILKRRYSGRGSGNLHRRARQSGFALYVGAFRYTGRI